MTTQVIEGRARQALRRMDDASRKAMLSVLRAWLAELDEAEARNRHAPQRVAALRVRSMLREVVS